MQKDSASEKGSKKKAVNCKADERELCFEFEIKIKPLF